LLDTSNHEYFFGRVDSPGELRARVEGVIRGGRTERVTICCGGSIGISAYHGEVSDIPTMRQDFVKQLSDIAEAGYTLENPCIDFYLNTSPDGSTKYPFVSLGWASGKDATNLADRRSGKDFERNFFKGVARTTNPFTAEILEWFKGLST
jgi:hypothetical protein